MSRHNVSNREQIEQLAQQHLAAVASVGERTLWVIVASEESLLKALAQSLNASFLPAESAKDKTDQISAILGGETQVLLHQVARPINISLLAAMAGTVKSGGLLILGIDEKLARAKDSANSNHSPIKPAHPASRSEQRFFRLFTQASRKDPQAFAFINLDAEAKSIELAGDSTNTEEINTPGQTLRQINNNITITKALIPQPPQTRQMHAVNIEQERLINEANAFAHTHTRCCIVIKGKRGRGKSTLLAKLAMQALERGETCFVTTNHPNALSTFWRECAYHQITYISPEDALNQYGSQPLFIDEAGNLPLPLVLKLIERHPKCILSTTTEGYETAGTAISVRLKAMLSQRIIPLLVLEPKLACRWRTPDPLENFFDKVTLAETQKTDSASTDPISLPPPNYDKDETPPIFREVQQHTLAQDDVLLESVYALLKQSHYQTTIDDLQHLLDASDIRLWIAQRELSGKVIAVLLASYEGGISHHYHDLVLAKRRRIPHQLLPQLLAQTANSSRTLQCQFLRVIRIATAEQWRRQQHGTKLLQFVEQTVSNTQTQPVDAIGASFASDHCASSFWNANGYTLFHQGFRPNPRSGMRSKAVLKAFSPTTSADLEQARSITSDNQQVSNTDFPSGTRPAMNHPITYDDTALLTRFARNQRSKNDTLAALMRLSSRIPLTLLKENGVSQKQHERLLRQEVANYLNSNKD